jgi:type IV pilus assembly protein PilA
MIPSLRARTQLELLNRLREKKKPLQEGFTLVELMIVVAVVGIISAVAVPNFLRSRVAATAGSMVGTALALAKECASLAVSDIGNAPAGLATGVLGPGTSLIVDCTNTGGRVRGIYAPIGVPTASGIRCLNKTSTTASRRVDVSISPRGSISCLFTT